MKNKTLKRKFIAGLLIGTMTLATVVAGCGKKNTSDKDSTSIKSTSDTSETKTMEEETLPAEVETETETDEDGNVTVKTTVYETDAEGETVTDADGNGVVAETKSEKFTKEEWESKEKETTSGATKPSKEKETSSQDKVASSETKPAATKPAANNNSNTGNKNNNSSNTGNTTNNKNNSGTASTQPATKPAEKVTEAPKQTEAPKATVPSNWQKIEMKEFDDDEYGNVYPVRHLYTNGEWAFDYTLDPLDTVIFDEDVLYNDKPYAEFVANYLWDCEQNGVTPEKGIYLIKYRGNATELRLPESIDGIKVLGYSNAILQNNKTVKTLTIPASYEKLGDYYYNVVEKVIVESGSKINEWGGVFERVGEKGSYIGVVVYCDNNLFKTLSEHIEHCEPVILKSLDGTLTDDSRKNTACVYAALGETVSEDGSHKLS